MADFITVKVKGNLNKYMDDIAQKQIPFAMAKALTDTTARLGSLSANQAQQDMELTRPWAGRYKSARIGGQPSPYAAFASVPANKKDPIKKMQSIVGTIGWQVAEQIAQHDSSRQPHKAEHLYIPINADRTKRSQQPKALIESGKGFYIITSKSKHKMLCIRKNGEIVMMYKVVDIQEIKPVFDFVRQVERNAPRLFPVYFNRAMKMAIKTAK